MAFVPTWMDGFEISPRAMADWYPSRFGNNYQDVYTGRGGGSGKAARFAGSGYFRSPQIGDGTFSEIRTCVAIRPDSIASTGSFIRFFATDLSNDHCGVGMTSDGKVTAGREGSVTNIGQSSAQRFFAGTWTHLEVAVKIHATAGVLKVWVNGETSPVIDFSGDTYWANSAVCTHVTIAQGGISGEVYVDDWIVGTDVGLAGPNIGDLKIRPLMPNGNGNVNQWLGSDGNSTDNYLLVDEDPRNTTDYVSSATVGDKDLYALGNTPTELVGGSPKLVSMHYFVQKSDSGPRSITPVVRSGGTDFDQTAQTLNEGWAQFHSGPFDNDPATSAEWTESAVDALQVGVKVS